MPWIKLTYISPWDHRPHFCVLTHAEASGIWKDRKYAIYDREYGSNVAFWPYTEKNISYEPMNREEACRWLRRTSCKEIKEDFDRAYEII